MLPVELTELRKSLKPASLYKVREHYVQQTKVSRLPSWRRAFKAYGGEHVVIKAFRCVNSHSQNASLLYLATGETAKCKTCESVILPGKEFCDGKCSAKQCWTQEARASRTATCIGKYGTDNPAKHSKVIAKVKRTNKRNHGGLFHTQTEEFKAGYRETMQDKYGVDNSLKSELVKEKIKQICVDRYGVEDARSARHTIRKRLITNRKRYGAPMFLVTREGKRKSRNTYRLRTGYSNPAHNPEVMARRLIASHRKKIFVDSVGNEHICQGYEPTVLGKINSDGWRVRTGCESLRYWSSSENKWRRYHPDIFCVKDGKRRVIEVKCDYTLLNDLEVNMDKFQAAIDRYRSMDATFWLALVLGNGGEVKFYKEPTVDKLRAIASSML